MIGEPENFASVSAADVAKSVEKEFNLDQSPSSYPSKNLGEGVGEESCDHDHGKKRQKKSRKRTEVLLREGLFEQKLATQIEQLSGIVTQNLEPQRRATGLSFPRCKSDMALSHQNISLDDQTIASRAAEAFDAFLKQQEHTADVASVQSGSSFSSSMESDIESEEFKIDGSVLKSSVDDHDLDEMEQYLVSVEMEQVDVSVNPVTLPRADLSLASASTSSKNSWSSQSQLLGIDEPSLPFHKLEEPIRRSDLRTASCELSSCHSLLYDVTPCRTFEQQLSSLTIKEQCIVMSLKQRWSRSGRPPFPDMWYLKFARCSPGRPFSAKSAYKVMKACDVRFINLSVRSMEKQLKMKTIFPVRGLTSMNGLNMFYMRPSRYFPRLMDVDSVIDNLIYVMDCMMDNEASQRNGIGFVVNMTDWTMENFEVDYCYKFMMCLQGNKSPTRVKLFLIVNPPSWFGSIWRIMKPMLSHDFRKKVYMIPFSRMNEFLSPGFEEFLPDDMYSGRQSTNFIVNDFIHERMILEDERTIH